MKFEEFLLILSLSQTIEIVMKAKIQKKLQKKIGKSALMRNVDKSPFFTSETSSGLLYGTRLLRYETLDRCCLVMSTHKCGI